MDLGIKELGITLIVGVFTLLGAEVIAHFLFNRPLTTFFYDVFRKHKLAAADIPEAQPATVEHKDGKEATVTLVVFAGLVFAVGMIVETISFKYVDDQDLIIKEFPALVLGERLTRTIGMPAKEDDRVAALLGSVENPQRWPLAVDLAHSDAFLISDNSATGQRVQKWLKNGCTLDAADCATRSDIQYSVESLYYYAKNMAYSHQNHYHELSQIQSRLEFARSLSVIGFLYFALVLAFIVVQAVRRLSKRAKLQITPQELKRARIRTAAVAGAFFCVYLLGLWAYGRETEAFNMRAFGYLSSHLIQEKRASAQARAFEAEKARLQAATNSSLAASASPATRTLEGQPTR